MSEQEEVLEILKRTSGDPARRESQLKRLAKRREQASKIISQAQNEATDKAQDERSALGREF